MKWTRILGAAVVALGLAATAQAGILDGLGCEKSCDCAATCQPECCAPTIARPCYTRQFTYQRQCSDIKPPCCDSCDAPVTCCAPACCAAPADSGCVPGCEPACAAPCGDGCADACCAAPCETACVADPGCEAPCAVACDPGCAAPCETACVVDSCDNGGCPSGKGCFGGKKMGGLLGGLFGCKKTACDAGCEVATCDNGCGPVETCSLFKLPELKKMRIPRFLDCEDLFEGRGKGCFGHDSCDGCDGGCCEQNACEVAKLIYTAQTACYARDRAEAVDDLGDYDCRCNPEIMTALLYSLNDSDERVRAQAADEIGDVIRQGKCCCSAEVVAALRCALADCDPDVVDQAEEALEACGYEVVDGCCPTACCETGCTTGCTTGCGTVTGTPTYAAPVAPPAPVSTPAPASAPMPVQTSPAPAPAAPAAEAPMRETPAADDAPAPPNDPEAYFPSRFRRQTSKPVRKNSLSNLFGMAN